MPKIPPTMSGVQGPSSGEARSPLAMPLDDSGKAAQTHLEFAPRAIARKSTAVTGLL